MASVTISDGELFLRIGLAAGVGVLLGAEREWRAQFAGMKTHGLVAAGAALFTLAGAYGFADLPQAANSDPMRVAAQVASGIGFIGAGAILRQGASVRGVTTAASLWAAAALGVACAAGFYAAALAGGVIVLITLVVLRSAAERVRAYAWDHERVLSLEYERGHGTLGPLLRELGEIAARIESIAVDDEGPHGDPGVRRVELHLRTGEQDRLEAVLEACARWPEVRHAALRRVERRTRGDRGWLQAAG